MRDESTFSILPDPHCPNQVWVKRDHWPDYVHCTVLPCADANLVFSTLERYPAESDYIASPVVYREGSIAYASCSRDTRSILVDDNFPVNQTYDTLRSVISAMLDLHEFGFGGLPTPVSSFVRTEDKTQRCKLYHAASRIQDAMSVGEWERVVDRDYDLIEKFVRELIQNPGNSEELMKSKPLFNHFLFVLREHCKKSIEERTASRSLLLGHPLLMSYNLVKKYLQFVGACFKEKNPKQQVVVDTLQTINDVDWIGNVEKFRGDHWDKYALCIKQRKYRPWGSNGPSLLFIQYLRDFIGHPHPDVDPLGTGARQYDLHKDDFCWEAMIRQIEEFYPCYLGFIWVALENAGVRPELEASHENWARENFVV